MKDWFKEHKLFIVIAVLIATGGIYYFFIYHETPAPVTETQLNDMESELQGETTVKEPEKPAKEEQKTETIMVDVKGQIKHPGVYPATQGERVIDLIERAGGLAKKADESQVNFAEHVQDEMVINIPAKGETDSSPSGIAVNGAAGPSGSTPNNAKVDLNKADVTQFQTLPGIGPAKAAAILEYRETSGGFKAVEDLKNISGIGDKTFEKLKDLVEVH
ncbi:helix-hairpin-helix domain-containing protein [Neobacillus niacini]|uniref:helix-hairpin-helix domain-containing protein n=1 Tax=Neobacillus niacini TaxID=86668 RepID=UPI0028664F33|nr:helix-hairpin-helix domain-containing protein [Neobacillus niacini]MDR7000390.1 competence protein ComEA [Neobacillus niacini]